MRALPLKKVLGWGISSILPSIILPSTILPSTILLSVVMLGWAKWTLLASVNHQYTQSYQAMAPNKTYSGAMEDEVVSFIIDKINQELSVIQPQATLPALGQCQVNDITATAKSGELSRWWSMLLFRLVLDDPYHHLRYTGQLRCTVNWGVLGGSQLVLLAFLIVVIRVVPKPLCRHTTDFIQQFTQLGFKHEEAARIAASAAHQRTVIAKLAAQSELGAIARDKLIELVEHYQLREISEREITWLVAIYQQSHNEEQAFLNTFSLPEQVLFRISERLVVIKGIEIKLTPTPYFYYLWYAQKRLKSEEGWVLNPLTTKADHELAAELIALMEQYGGHAKAINDLARNGLTAKKLDQNRNKIKDELVAALGEELAMLFLFEGRREPASQRYLYRIQASKEKFKIS